MTSVKAALKTVAITVASWGTNRIDLFRLGKSSELQHKWWSGSSWGGWESLGGTFTSVPAVTAWSSNRLNLVGTGTDSGAWYKWWDGNLTR